MGSINDTEGKEDSAYLTAIIQEQKNSNDTRTTLMFVHTQLALSAVGTGKNEAELEKGGALPVLIPSLELACIKLVLTGA